MCIEIWREGGMCACYIDGWSVRFWVDEESGRGSYVAGD